MKQEGKSLIEPEVNYDSNNGKIDGNKLNVNKNKKDIVVKYKSKPVKNAYKGRNEDNWLNKISKSINSFSIRNNSQKNSARSVRNMQSLKSNSMMYDDEKEFKEGKIVETQSHETIQFELNVSDTSLYNQSIDVYSFGVIMYEVGTLIRIYEGMDMNAIRDMVVHGKRIETETFEKLNESLSKKRDPDKENGEDENKQTDTLQSKIGFEGIPENVYYLYNKLIGECWAQKSNDRPKFWVIEEKLEHILKIYKEEMIKKQSVIDSNDTYIK